MVLDKLTVLSCSRRSALCIKAAAHLRNGFFGAKNCENIYFYVP
jgi:hypothetical protein